MDTKVNDRTKLEQVKLGYEAEAWVFTGLSKDSIFKRFDNLRDAVVEAINHVNAHVLQNGAEIVYGKVTEGVAYYKCVNTGEIVLIECE